MSKAFDALQPGRKSNPDASLNSRSTDNAVGKDSQDVDRDRDSGRGGPKHRRTLWMGGLEPNVTEAAIVAAFRSAGSHVPSRVQSEHSLAPRLTPVPLPPSALPR